MVRLIFRFRRWLRQLFGFRPKVYLAGGMEKAKKLGATWRANFTPFLEDLEFDVLDPVVLEKVKLTHVRVGKLPKTFKTIKGKVEKLEHWHQLKRAVKECLHGKFKAIMEHIIEYDLKIVNNMDMVIAYWDKSAKGGGGTYGEIQEAWKVGIPVYAVATVEMPAWTNAQCKRVFRSFPELKRFLKKEYGNKCV